MAEGAGIGRRIGAGGPADRALIDENGAGEILGTGERFHMKDFVRPITAVKARLEVLVENLVEQRGFSRTRYTRDHIETAERDIGIEMADVIEIGVPNFESTLVLG